MKLSFLKAEIPELDSELCTPLAWLNFNPRKYQYEVWMQGSLRGWISGKASDSHVKFWLKERFSITPYAGDL